jgi:hypothetical protein
MPCRIFLAGSSRMLRPSILMSPLVEGDQPIDELERRRFPPPDGPTSTQNVPAGIVSEILERGALTAGVALGDVVEDDLAASLMPGLCDARPGEALRMPRAGGAAEDEQLRL